MTGYTVAAIVLGSASIITATCLGLRRLGFKRLLLRSYCCSLAVRAGNASRTPNGGDTETPSTDADTMETTPTPPTQQLPTAAQAAADMLKALAGSCEAPVMAAAATATRVLRTASAPVVLLPPHQLRRPPRASVEPERYIVINVHSSSRNTSPERAGGFPSGTTTTTTTLRASAVLMRSESPESL